MLPAIYRIVSLTSKSPWMTFWASLSVGISEPPASQVQQRSRVQVDVFWKGTVRKAQVNSQDRELWKQSGKKSKELARRRAEYSSVESRVSTRFLDSCLSIAPGREKTQ